MKQFTPRPYQDIGIDHIFANKRCALFARMGMGKTSTSIAALDALDIVSGDSFPALVIAPLRVARSTWPDEVAKWDNFGHLTISAIVGSEKERIAALNVAAEIYTVNYEALPWLVEHLGDEWPFRTVIADESTKLKGFRTRQGTKRAKALARVAHKKVDRFIALTGTPAPNGLVDLWGQLWFVDGGKRLGKTYSAFIDRWFKPDWSGFGVVPLEHAQSEIEAAISDVCLTLDPRDWFDLREPVSNVIYVDLPAKARAQYKELERTMFLEIDGAEIEATHAASLTIKCLQLANGAIYTNAESKEWAEVHDEKISALESIVEEASGDALLVAYHFRPDLERLQKALGKKAYILASDDGKAFKAGKYQIGIVHAQSVGHGIDGLQNVCNQIAFFGHWWNLEEREQLIERIGPVRQLQAGLDRPMFVHDIVARGTVDELALERHRTKANIQEILLNALKQQKGKNERTENRPGISTSSV